MEMTDHEEFRMVKNIKQKHRYATDPEYREKCKARSSAYYATNREKVSAKWRERYHGDPAFREAVKRRATKWTAKNGEARAV